MAVPMGGRGPLYYAKSGLDDLMLSFSCTDEPVIPLQATLCRSQFPFSGQTPHDAPDYHHVSRPSSDACNAAGDYHGTSDFPAPLTNCLLEGEFRMSRPIAGLPPSVANSPHQQQGRWSTPMTIPAAIPQDECSRASVPAATEPSLDYRDDEDDELSRDSTPAAGKRRWCEQARTKHSQACKAKGRLTLAEKLEIIRLYESCDPQEHKSRVELAVMYGKSRMTISTTLRPDNVARYRQLGESGVRLEAKRCKRNDHGNLERCAFEAIGKARIPIT